MINENKNNNTKIDFSHIFDEPVFKRPSQQVELSDDELDEVDRIFKNTNEQKEGDYFKNNTVFQIAPFKQGRSFDEPELFSASDLNDDIDLSFFEIPDEWKNDIELTEHAIQMFNSADKEAHTAAQAKTQDLLDDGPTLSPRQEITAEIMAYKAELTLLGIDEFEQFDIETLDLESVAFMKDLKNKMMDTLDVYEMSLTMTGNEPLTELEAAEYMSAEEQDRYFDILLEHSPAKPKISGIDYKDVECDLQQFSKDSKNEDVKNKQDNKLKNGRTL